MIRISLAVNNQACIQRLEARGHAAKQGRMSLVCASASVLLRSFADAVARERPEAVELSAPDEGDLSLTLRSANFDPSWLRGASDTLLVGLSRLEQEAGHEVRLLLEKEI